MRPGLKPWVAPACKGQSLAQQSGQEACPDSSPLSVTAVLLQTRAPCSSCKSLPFSLPGALALILPLTFPKPSSPAVSAVFAFYLTWQLPVTLT